MQRPGPSRQRRGLSHGRRPIQDAQTALRSGKPSQHKRTVCALCVVGQARKSLFSLLVTRLQVQRLRALRRGCISPTLALIPGSCSYTTVSQAHATDKGLMHKQLCAAGRWRSGEVWSGGHTKPPSTASSPSAGSWVAVRLWCADSAPAPHARCEENRPFAWQNFARWLQAEEQNKAWSIDTSQDPAAGPCIMSQPHEDPEPASAAWRSLGLGSMT